MYQRCAKFGKKISCACAKDCARKTNDERLYNSLITAKVDDNENYRNGGELIPR